MLDVLVDDRFADHEDLEEVDGRDFVDALDQEVAYVDDQLFLREGLH